MFSLRFDHKSLRSVRIVPSGWLEGRIFGTVRNCVPVDWGRSCRGKGYCSRFGAQGLTSPVVMGGKEIVPSDSLAMGCRATVFSIGRPTRSSDSLSPRRPRRKYERTYMTANWNISVLTNTNKYRLGVGGEDCACFAHAPTNKENVAERHCVLQTAFAGCFLVFPIVVSRRHQL